jgi:hypothetical protein
VESADLSNSQVVGSKPTAVTTSIAKPQHTREERSGPKAWPAEVPPKQHGSNHGHEEPVDGEGVQNDCPRFLSRLQLDPLPDADENDQNLEEARDGSIEE